MIRLAHPEREKWRLALREGVVAGSVASVLSTAMLALAGRRQDGEAIAPVNAVSHWAWGDEAAAVLRPTWRHTAVGVLTQHAASIFWAALYSRAYGQRPEAKQLPNAIAGGIATSAVAFVVDYTVTPRRLTPGYELRLRPTGMLAVYAALAVGFSAGALLLRGRA